MSSEKVDKVHTHRYSGLQRKCNSDKEEDVYDESNETMKTENPRTSVHSVIRSLALTGGFLSRTKNALARQSTLGPSILASPLSPASDGSLYCNLEESPLYIFKACAQGLTDVVERLLNEDPKKITLTDSKGWTCLHHAANRSKLIIVDILLKKGADINAVDENGNTPLHIAVEKNQKDAVNHLLMNKADATILNKKLMSPLHHAVYLNKPKMVEELLKHPDSVTVDIKGHTGKRPIHLAAAQDHWECADILMKAGSKLCQPCDNGYFAVHMAAKNAASKTLRVLLDEGVKNGYNIEKLLEFHDKENNSPLHLAVNSGDIDIVQTCLDFGAKVDAMQENKSTALHFACAQGTLPIVKLLFETHLKQVPSDDNGRNLLLAKDVLNMTPLHRAAMHDHAEVVSYLIEKQRTFLDEQDIENRTPLLLSAVRCGSRSFRALLEAGANIQVKGSNLDKLKRNVLHYLVTYTVGQAGVVPEINEICRTEEGLRLLNQKDSNGCTPLHLATKEGNIKFTETLIKLGAIVNLKDNEDQSPLHFAARYGRYNTVQRLLESHAGPNIINESDGGGLTALHIASQNGHTKVVQLLLHKGALMHKDYLGRSPLHLAAENGYTQTIRMLLSFHTNLLDQTCKKESTALHYAAEANQASTIDYLLSVNCKYSKNIEAKTPLDIAVDRLHVECAQAMMKHDRMDEILKCYDVGIGCPLIRLIQHLPEVYKTVLDRSYSKCECDRGNKNYWEKFNFHYMQVENSRRRQLIANGNNIPPLFALNTMVHFGRGDLLAHPVCLTYLNMKWLAYGFWFFFVNILLYMTFVISLTKAVVTTHLVHVAFIGLEVNETLDNEANETMPLSSKERTAFCSLALFYVCLFAFLNMLKELVQIYQQRYHYFSDYVNYMEWTLYATSMAFAAPALITYNSDYLQWECGSVALFVAWFNLLLYLQRLDTVGLYVVMFRQILQTILKVVLVFSVLFIAFGLTFYILLWADVQAGFKTPFVSIVHSVMFMMGDWNYVDVFARPYLRQPGAGYLAYPALSYLFLFLFVVLIPILFINLLIGLAVGDIEIVQRDANLKRLAMQVEYHTELEEKLPQKLLDKVDRMEVLIYPNRCGKNSLFTLGIDKLRNMCGGKSELMTSSGSFTYQGGMETSSSDGVLVELNKSKKKLKDVQNQLDRMHDLLRLVVQKMEISEEADYYDERSSFKSSEDEKKVMNKSRALRLKAKLAPIVSTSMKQQ